MLGNADPVVAHRDAPNLLGPARGDPHDWRDAWPGELHRVGEEVQQHGVHVVRVGVQHGQLSGLDGCTGRLEHGCHVRPQLLDDLGEVDVPELRGVQDPTELHVLVEHPGEPVSSPGSAGQQRADRRVGVILQLVREHLDPGDDRAEGDPHVMADLRSQLGDHGGSGLAHLRRGWGGPFAEQSQLDQLGDAECERLEGSPLQGRERLRFGIDDTQPADHLPAGGIERRRGVEAGVGDGPVDEPDRGELRVGRGVLDHEDPVRAHRGAAERVVRGADQWLDAMGDRHVVVLAALDGDAGGLAVADPGDQLDELGEVDVVRARKNCQDRVRVRAGGFGACRHGVVAPPRSLRIPRLPEGDLHYPPICRKVKIARDRDLALPFARWNRF